MGHLSENTRNFGRWVHWVRTNGTSVVITDVFTDILDKYP